MLPIAYRGESRRLRRIWPIVPSCSLLVVALAVLSSGQTPQAPGGTPVLPGVRAPSGATNLTNSTEDAGAGGNAIKSTQERLAKVRAELVARTESAPAGSLRVSLLQRLERLYEQQISYIPELEALKVRRAARGREARSWTSFAEPRPYSIFLSDNLRESIRVERVEISKAESALTILMRLIEEYRVSVNRAEERIRGLNDALEKTKDAEVLTRERETERLRSQAAAATISVLDLERQMQEERLGASRDHLGLLERQLVIAKAATAFTEEDLRKVQGILQSGQRQIERELAETESRKSAAADALDAAEDSLRRVQAELNVDVSGLTRAAELVSVRRIQAETIDTVVNGLRFILHAGAFWPAIWEARFESYGSRSAETLRWGEHQLSEFRSRIELWKSYYTTQLEAAASQISLQEERLAGLDPASDLASLVRERLASLRERDQLLLRVVRNIEGGDHLVEHLDESLSEASAKLPFWGRVRNAFSDTRSFLSRIWNLELFAVQDTIVVDGQEITGKRAITFGKIASAILILVIGFWAASQLSRWTQPLIIKRFKIDPEQARLIHRWVRVVAAVSLAVFSLVSVKIPLTVFAFAGGALAIALGFGMQTLLKNFVCGIIILFERPFHVGDILDVSGQRGKLVDVGIRSSVLQLWDNTETLIPNSALLENSVTNWTYSNRKVRFTISVGVDYQSDTRRVVAVLTEITKRHGLVEKDPEPQILFVDFGESVLMFEVRFWVDVIKTNAAQVSSDLRQMIAVSFAEQGIVIAFPQRSVHLDGGQPLQVQVVPVSGRAAEKSGAKDSGNDGKASGIESINSTKPSMPASRIP